ncbi:MAG: hypothetical protein PHU40_05180 [Sulfurimonas sp.]|nr:hypothetical protein [Sulfurimonas sp.]
MQVNQDNKIQLKLFEPFFDNLISYCNEVFGYIKTGFTTIVTSITNNIINVNKDDTCVCLELRREDYFTYFSPSYKFFTIYEDVNQFCDDLKQYFQFSIFETQSHKFANSLM